MANQATDWIEWAGGECPVNAETYVIVRFRAGHSGDVPERAGFWSGGTRDWWRHEGHSHTNIIAYRVVPA